MQKRVRPIAAATKGGLPRRPGGKFSFVIWGCRITPAVVVGGVSVVCAAVFSSYLIEHGSGAFTPSVPEMQVHPDAQFDVPCPGDDVVKSFVGMSLNSAIYAADARHMEVRIVYEDDQALPASDDFDPRRINFSIENGKVRASTCG